MLLVCTTAALWASIGYPSLAVIDGTETLSYRHTPALRAEIAAMHSNGNKNNTFYYWLPRLHGTQLCCSLSTVSCVPHRFECSFFWFASLLVYKHFRSTRRALPAPLCLFRLWRNNKLFVLVRKALIIDVTARASSFYCILLHSKHCISLSVV